MNLDDEFLRRFIAAPSSFGISSTWVIALARELLQLRVRVRQLEEKAVKLPAPASRCPACGDRFPEHESDCPIR